MLERGAPRQYTTPYPYLSLLPRRVRVAGLGQNEVRSYELVDGLQAFPKPLADSIAANLAAMIWVPTLSTSYTAYSPGSYEVNFGAPPLAAPGYPGEASAPGAYVLANPATVAPVDALSAGTPLDRINVVVAPNKADANEIAAPGGPYGVVLAPAATPPGTTTIAGRRFSTGAIVAGLAAAAVAAVLLFA